MSQIQTPLAASDEKYVKRSEFILYLVAVFFYKLTGKTKEDMHNAVIEQRARFDAEAQK